MDDHYGYTMPSQRHTQNTISSYPSSPPNEPPPYSMTSSHSSVDSVHGGSGRLVTIHLEKTESIIWPSLIVGPVPVALSRPGDGFEEPIYPWASSAIIEADYNMDPTSLVLIGLDLCDIREAYTDAFEYFVRAWHQASVPSATIRLVTHYLPLHTSLPSDYLTSTVPSEAEGAKDEPSTPTPTASTWLGDPSHGTTQYYLSRIGHDVDLAQLYRCAGMLHHEGRATALLSSAYTGLSSLRSPVVVSGNTGHGYGSNLGSHAHSSEEWKRNQDCAWQYLERARMLNPAIENPLSLRDSESEPSSGAESGDAKGSRSGAEPCRKEQQQTHFKMPTIEVTKDPPANQPRRRRKKTSGDLSSSFMENCRETPDVDDDRTWYLYIPGLVGAGTALLVVGFLSFSSWRKSQGGS
ncbi:hypothetical protein POSPLADRAFT_1048972 [Postia placenta MAD-698-R-SB12]|uniref:CS domain-containing protein n=1 Tax=Postia placenta MAD-698-R-SB12 TaxID=670580 RepID=A0A1X6MQT8_9APHY|nr:hypothetical protein POSPLADRAFT_1048972 [Postia placenta MAD-698-R-SB12]OSX58774.1 hypothetical protein POSPLADRAFT_1048972 [Postia placenta MAD-698-R-SB12]